MTARPRSAPPNPFKVAETECRASTDPCDPAEVCNGITPDCPPDVVVTGGEVCNETACCPPPERCLAFSGCGIGGGNGQRCFVDGSCNAGFACEINPIADPPTLVCRPCGGVGELCCGDAVGGIGGTCDDPDLMCTFNEFNTPNTVCRHCGGDGEVCCADVISGSVACDPGFICEFVDIGFGKLLCSPCGGEGDPCCQDDISGSVACDPGFTCDHFGGSDFSSVCRPCGGLDELCCGFTPGGAEGTCDPELLCIPEFIPGQFPTSVCRVCGGLDEPCCGGTSGGFDGTCDDPELTCSAMFGTSGRVCRVCGGHHEPCCISPSISFTCDSGLMCAQTTTTLDGLTCLTPEECGSAGQPCCVVPSACDAGLECGPEGTNMVCR